MSRIYRCALVICFLLTSLFLRSTPARAEFRSFDGTDNNLAHVQWGAAETDFARMAPVDYADKIATARLAGRPNPRSVGSALFRQTAPRPDSRLLSGYVYAFGNFISHDSQNTISGTTEFVPFQIPLGDDIFLPNQTVQLPRSLFDANTGKSVNNPRQQTNFTTAFLDASQVYGADATADPLTRALNSARATISTATPRISFRATHSGRLLTRLLWPATAASTTISFSPPCTRCLCASTIV